MISFPAVPFLSFYFEIVALFSSTEDFLWGGNDDRNGFSQAF